MQQVLLGSNSSELLMCGSDVRSILLLPLVARCLETIDGFVVWAENCITAFTQVCRKRRLKDGFTA